MRPGMSASDELAVLPLERAQHRLERREGVAGDLRRRPGQAAQQRGLAGVGQPDEPDVGQQLEAQVEPALAAGQPALGEARGLAGGPGEALVAPAAGAAAGDHDAPPGDDQVVQRAVLRRHLRARRHAHDEVVAVGAVALGALAVAPAGCLEVRAALERLQVAQGVVAQQHDGAAVAAVAAVGAAARHVGLAAEGQAAVPAGPRLNEDASLVVEHR